MREAKRFWDELLFRIEHGQVIPVVGPELLTIRNAQGDEVPFYEEVARRLLADYDVEVSAAASPGEVDEAAVVLRPFHELNDAVCALTGPSQKEAVDGLYRPIYEIIAELVKNLPDDALQPLRDLASIPTFDLFVTTTPDGLLARAIGSVRDGYLDHIVFSPKLSTAELRDFPKDPPHGYTAVCYLFGEVAAVPTFAIHDEDTLEYFTTFPVDAAVSMEQLLDQLRKQNLLLVGCHFSDWLSRFFIRIANKARLSNPRDKKEFMIAQQQPDSANLTLFLERFSPNTLALPGTAREFVAELTRRWRERHPDAPREPQIEANALVPPPPAESIFISYSREDAVAANKLYTRLQALGTHVAWFDKMRLGAGNDWSLEIRNAINSCDLFLPLLSASTEQRKEANFREEWTTAVERSRKFSDGSAFIVPIVLDRDYDGSVVRYKEIPNAFKREQFGHAPDGDLPDDLRDQLDARLGEARDRKRRPA